MQDLTTTRFVLPPDTNLLTVEKLSPRLRAKLGPVNNNEIVITRPGCRVMTRLVTNPLAELLGEFRVASLLTDAVQRFSKNHNQDASEILDMSFDSLVTFITGRILVPSDSKQAYAVTPSLAAGQAFSRFEIEKLVRSLDDTEVYRARDQNDSLVALKVARNDRASAVLAEEARILEKLKGKDTPLLLNKGMHDGRAWLAMEWRSGVLVSVAAQQARASGDLV